MSVASDLIIVEIVEPDHVEALRYLRNLTSAGFSSFNGFIDYDQQQAWWQEMHGRVKGWLYWQMEAQLFGGFGVLRESDGRWWNSIGVHPICQGRGYGSFITRDLIARHAEPIYAIVRRDNLVARRMHHPGDWDEIDGPDAGRIYFRSKS